MDIQQSSLAGRAGAGSYLTEGMEVIKRLCGHEDSEGGDLSPT